MKRTYAILISLLLLQFVVKCGLILHAGPMTNNGLYGDDSYMSHKFAQNIAEGRGISQAGSPNNGFQPLYVFLIVPLFWFLDPLQATLGTALINAALHTLASFFLFRVIRAVANDRCALAGVLLWTCSAYLTRISLNGLETALANFFMLLLLDFHLASRCGDNASSEPALSTRGAAGSWGVPAAACLGLVMGLAFLSRLDLGLLLLPLGIDQILYRLRRREGIQLATTISVGAVVIAPWFLWSRLVCGSWMPLSGKATRTVAQLYGSPTGPVRDPSYFPLGEIPWSFYESHLRHAFKHIVLDAPVNLVGRLITESSPWLGLLGLLPLLFLFAFGRAGAPQTDNQVRWSRLWQRLWYLWLFVAALPLVYSFYCFAQWHFWRYLSPVAIALLIPSACLLDPLLSRVSGRHATVVWGIGSLAVGALLLGGRAHASLAAAPDPTGIAYRLYEDSQSLAEELPRDSRVGSFESGTLDYFMARDIYNLDGKTDARALEALREGRIDRHIRELGLDFIVSSPPLIRDLLSRRGRWHPGELTVIARHRHNLVVVVQPSEMTTEP